MNKRDNLEAETFRWLWRPVKIGEGDRDAIHGCWSVFETEESDREKAIELLERWTGFKIELKSG